MKTDLKKIEISDEEIQGMVESKIVHGHQLVSYVVPSFDSGDADSEDPQANN